MEFKSSELVSTQQVGVTPRQVRVRTANRKDIPAIDAMNRECLQENYSADTYDKWFKTDPDLFFVAEIFVTQQEVQQLPKEYLERLEDEQKMAGFWIKIGYIFAQPTVVGGISKRNDVHVYSFAVRAPYRGLKVGRMLLNALHDYLKQKGETNSTRLHVRVDNAIAIALYKKVGYKKKSITPKYYKDGTNAYVMVRQSLQDLSEEDWQKLFAKLQK